MKNIFKLLLLLGALLATQLNVKAQISCHAHAYTWVNGNTATLYDTSYVNSSWISNNNSYVSWGDGTISHSSNWNPSGSAILSHTYSSNGTYQVCDHIFDSLGNCSDTFCQTIVIGNTCGLQANYTYSATNNVVSFTNTSSGSFAYTTWNIDGGYKYFTTNAVDTFFATGNHTVCLKIYNSNGICTDSICQTINITSIPNSYSVSGYVYNDANNNGVKDAGETGFANQSVNVTLVGGGTATVQTNTSGFYQTNVMGGNYVFAPNFYLSGYSQTQPTFGSYTGTVSTATIMNFGFYQAPCAAIFSATATQQSVGVFLFTDSIQNKNSSLVYYWVYGDGSQNGIGSPSTHTYTTNGTYHPSLAIYDNSNQNCHDSFPMPALVVTGLTACAGQSQFTYYNQCNNFNFYINSSTANDTYTWDYGDGSAFGNGTYVAHTYILSGTYMVRCVAYNSPNSCYDTSSQTITVNITGVHAAFTYSISGNTVTVTNTSTGIISNYYWSYDDGFSSQLMNPPAHSFVSSGQHSISLSIYSGAGCNDSLWQPFNITIPNADTISGYVYKDVNSNGIKDAGESGISGQAVWIQSNGVNASAYTDPLGFYQFIIASGTDAIYGPNVWMYTQTQPMNTNHYTVTTTGNQTISGFNFGFVDTTSTITGHVYFDTNGNGTQDPGEADAQWIRVDVYGTHSQHVWTDFYGNYTALLYNGNGVYNISCNPVLSGYTGYNISTSPTQYNLTTSGANTYSGNDFGLNPISLTTGDNLMITVAPATTAVPGYGAYYYVTVKNIGSTTVGGNVVFNYDPSMTFIGSTFGTNNSALHQVSWNISSLAPGGYYNNGITLNTATTTSLGTTLSFNATVTLPTGFTDVDSTNNTNYYQQVVVGSFDPNVKSVSPVGVGSNGAINPNNNGELTYTIQFQNTGTAPAVNIVVKDVIDTDLDLNTLQMLEASNNYSLAIDDVTRMVTWKFQNILLPDSTHDEPHSHGFLQFKIKLKSSLSQGAALNNTANIYFDFNTAVATNTTTNTVDYALGVNDIVDGNLPTISVAPNPMNEFTTIRIDGLKGATAIDLTITNVLGEKVQVLSHQQNIISINRNNLSSGVYFYELKNNGNKIGSGKLVIE